MVAGAGQHGLRNVSHSIALYETYNALPFSVTCAHQCPVEKLLFRNGKSLSEQLVPNALFRSSLQFAKR